MHSPAAVASIQSLAWQLTNAPSAPSQKKKAIKEYEYLLIKNPENIDYTIALANIYIRRYQIFKARKIFSNYLKLHPQDKTTDKLKPYRFIIIFL